MECTRSIGLEASERQEKVDACPVLQKEHRPNISKTIRMVSIVAACPSIHSLRENVFVVDYMIWTSLRASCITAFSGSKRSKYSKRIFRGQIPVLSSQQHLPCSCIRTAGLLAKTHPLERCPSFTDMNIFTQKWIFSLPSVVRLRTLRSCNDAGTFWREYIL